MVRETRHLWVANLPDNTREDRIREHFQRYGRVQSVKIISASGGGNDTSPSSSATAITSTTESCCQTTADHHLTSSTNHSHHTQIHHRISCSHGKGSVVQLQQCGGTISGNLTAISIGICATIAFMDIKSASKAHLAEHKFDDRVLTTEYYEPSTMQLHSESLVISNKSENNVVVAGDMKQESMTTATAHQVASRYASTSSSHGSSDDHSPGYERTSFYDRVSTSQSGNRSTEASTEYIRRNSYHSNDIRGRQRERHFKNSPYSLIVDRPNQIHRNSWYETSSPSPSSSRNHYNNNQTLSNNSSSNVFPQPDSSYDRHNSGDLSDHQTSSSSPLSAGNGVVTTSNSNNNNLSKESCKLPPSTSATTTTIASDATSLPYKSKLLVNNHHHNHHHHNHHKTTTTLKSRSGSESPVSGRSSRSHSRSPSSCSSTHSSTPTSSRDSNSSPITAGVVGDTTQNNNNNTPSSHHHSHHHRHLKGNSSAGGKSGLSSNSQNSHSQRHRRNLQSSLASVPLIGVEKPVASSTSSLSSSGSLSGSNSLGFYSEDNRPLAICVRNLPLRSSDTSLKDGLFHEYKKHGKVTWVKVVGQSHDRYALVCFKKPEDVDKALEVSQDKLFFGCKIEVQPYQGYDVDDNEFRPYEAELDEYQPKSTRTLFIGNLEKDITVTELRKHFEGFGEILEIDIKKQGSSPYAFCQYADIVSVVKAVRKMDGEHLGSTRIKLGFGKSMPTTCVWFDNIAETVTESYLSQQCARFGNVQKVTIDRDRKMGLVTYEQISSATQAVKELRGIPLRGRKLQVDFASRECIEAFYARLEKREPATINNNYDSASSNATSASSANNNRYISNLSRSRASSFSRPGNQLSGTASPTSTPSAGSTPRHLSASGNSISRKFRYGTPEFYDSNEYLDTYGNFENERVIETDHMIANDAESITSSTRRRCDKSPVDGRIVQQRVVETECSGITSSSVRRRCERSPGDVRVLESQRYKILNQLEKCPSSGDEAESPKKRAKYSQDVEENHFNNHQDPSTTNCNGKVLDHREHSVTYSASTSTTSAYNPQHHHRFHSSSSSSEVAHRKTVEIRRLSDCNIKHSASVPGGAMTSNYTKPSRRPSTDSLTRYTATQMDSYQLHKRRKTSAGASTSSSSSSMTATTNEMMEKAIRERVNPIQSFERESGGESEHGSRPDTPLIDERPDNNLPTDPRTNRPPRLREVLNLPLPKFAALFHQQLREKNQLQPASHAYAEKHENSHHHHHHHHHSSLNKHRSISPSPQVRSRSNSILPPTVTSGGSSVSETLVASPHQTSLTASSNSSDSEPELGSIPGPSTSPSLEERLKKLSEDYDSWSSNGRSSSSSHYMSIRHSVPEISIPETPDLLRNVLKNSMFDEDSKRLENINTQPPVPTATAVTSLKTNFGSFNSNYLNISGTLSPLANLSAVVSVPEPPPCVLSKLHIPTQQPVQQPVMSTVLQQRLGSASTVSPMNSPNTASPYNSPNPSSGSSISSLKGLQYPFPSHPSSTTNVSTSTVTSAIVSLSNSSSSSPITTVVSSGSATTSISSATTVCSQKPKTCTMSKSISMQESTSTVSGSATCANNSNSNNFTASFNKSSTNNVNNSNNDNSSVTSASKLLVKSVSLPMPSPTEKLPEVAEIKTEIIVEEINKSETIVETTKIVENLVTVKSEPQEIIKKEDISEKRKERRKNSENEEISMNESFLKREKIRDAKKDKSSSTITTQKPKKIKEENFEEKRDDILECPPSPTNHHHKQRSSVEEIDSANEINNHIDNSKTDKKHHEKSSRHHKERKNSKPHAEHEETNIKKNDIHSSKDSIFDELKRNSKENIIKTNDKVHKSKKHHHHHRDGIKDKENQTQVHFNDTSSSIMNDDVINRSSEDDMAIKHHHNGKKPELTDGHESGSNRNKHDSSREEDGCHGKKRHQRRNLNVSISTDDTDESDGGTKRPSFFDIPDFEPNISMYDKVKARSCKNVKKQEEEKKIKDKFTALKQSRAKREKKRLNTSEDDSDSDMHDTNSNDMYQRKYRKSQLSGSDDDDMRDSDDEILSKKLKARNQLSICDDESSESGINIAHDGHKKRNRVFNRKVSRSNVIDSSDEEMPSEKDIKLVEIKQEPTTTADSYDELKKDHDGKNNKHSSKKRHHEKIKDDKANKKSKKVSKEHHRKSTSSTDSQQKREEDIFGSISEDDHKPNDIEIKKEKADDSIGSDTAIDQSKERREESKKRKEKREKRREREKQRLIKQEDNSVDLDEAGRALEAQLMSDSEQSHKQPLQKATIEKSDDVFHFTDDDNKQHHDSTKKKKKKKRTKEDRKHHHNHHHYENIKLEPILADNNLESNNNTKLKVDVISSDEIKPSVPSLIEDVSSKVDVKSIATSKKVESKQTIPGFGGPIDENVHEKAVMSIAAELEKKVLAVKEEIIPPPTKVPAEVHEKKVSKAEADKHEEKSRVVISQEETEDAVAALLGESFSMTHEDYNDPYDVPIVSDDNNMVETSTHIIPIAPEEDEEMKKAIMSLNSEIERKIDTPTSEHDLQIDTDTEEANEDDGLNNQQIMSFDEPPKTPDVSEIESKSEKAEISPAKSISSDESMKQEVKVVEKKVETPVKIEPIKKEEKPKESPQRIYPPSITIPTEPLSLSIEKTSPRKQLQSPGGVRIGPTYSPITPASGKDPPSSIFAKNLIPQKMTPLMISPTLGNSTSSLSSGAASPKFIGIPSKTEIKPIIIPPTQAPKTPLQQLPLPKPAEIKEQIKFIAAEKKIETKPIHSQNIPRQPQIIFPPSTIVTTPVAVNLPVETKEKWQANHSPITQKPVETLEHQQPLKVEKKEPSILDTSHEDVNEESESNSHDSSMEKEVIGKKTPRGGGKQRGRKAAVATSPSQNQHEIEVPSSPQTRRGGKTANASKRGRGGKATNSKIPVPTLQQQLQQQQNMPSPATPARQQKISECSSDVYEFHDDSGEELSKSGDQRPRLLMKISSAAPTGPTSAPPVITTSVINQPISPSIVQSTPLTITSVPSILIEPLSDSLISPSPLSQQASSPAQSDDFAQPNNTRKSKRLLEKDGPRTSVDDTIDDVIRNVGTLIQPHSIAQQQAIQAANSRATRATRQNANPSASIAVSNIPVSQPAPVITQNPSVEVKKVVRGGKKQSKDRKISETSESENEKKVEKPIQVPAPQPIPSVPVPSVMPQVINVEQKIVHIPPQIQQQINQPVTIVKQLEIPPVKKDSAELLIDPVTGELQKMTQSKEGQYVPVSEHRAHIPMNPNHPSVVSYSIPPQHQQAHQPPQIYQVESKIIQEEKKIIQTPPTHHNVIKVSSPVVLEPPKQSVITESSHIIKPVITQNPQAIAKMPPHSLPQQIPPQVHPHKSYIYSQSPVKPPITIVTTSIPQTPSTTVISSQPSIVKMTMPAGTMQPATIYNLPNIIPQQSGLPPTAKYVTQIPQSNQPKTAIVLPQQQQQQHQNQPTIIHPPSAQQPQIIHQKIPITQPQQIVIHPQLPPHSQSAGNLMINIPPHSSLSGQAGMPSPRMTVKQVIRTIPQQQQPQQIPTAAASVLVKTTPQGQPPSMPHQTIVTQELSKAPTRPTYIQQGNKLIEAYVPPGGRGDVIFVEGKHTMYPNYQAKYPVPHQQQQPTQNKPAQIIQQVKAPSQSQQQQMQTQPKIVDKMPSQSSVNIQHPMHQQKVYLTHSGQVIPMPQQTAQSEQWTTHEKISAAPQSLKNRFMDYEEVQRVAQQQQQQIKRIYVNDPPQGANALPSQPPHNVVQGKTIIGLNQTPQILTGAVASPPLKAHMSSSQQPIVTGASSSRIAVPTASPKEQQHFPRHYPHEAYEESVMHGDRSASYRSQSPPPAHQTSPLTTRAPYMLPQKLYTHQPSTMYLRGADYGRMPISRIGLPPGATEAREMPEIEEPRAASPPLELRRTTSMPLQSPSDRITDSPMMAPALYASPRIPQPYFYDGESMKPLPTAEPPPAHRAHTGPVYTAPQQQSSLPPPTNLAHIQRDQHREHRDKDEPVTIVATTQQQQPKESEVRYQYVYPSAAQNAQTVQGLAPATNPRPLQMTTPPIASQVPSSSQPDSLSRLLEVYPLMWQGLLALKTEQAAVQMHFVYGNKKIAKASLPVNADHTTPPLRIAQRMRMETSQIDGVARKMQITDEHCILLALPCGFDYSDVLRQTENLQVSFINYLRSKQAAGIINIADPGSQNASYVVHIFPSCDFANESLERIAPDLMYKVSNIAYLLIVIATV